MKRPRIQASARLRHRLRLAALLAFVFALGSAWPAFGQLLSSGGQLAVRSDGFIFWVENGTRHVVYPAQMSDEQINAYPEGVPFAALLAPPSGAPAGSPAPIMRSRAFWCPPHL